MVIYGHEINSKFDDTTYGLAIAILENLLERHPELTDSEILHLAENAILEHPGHLDLPDMTRALRPGTPEVPSFGDNVVTVAWSEDEQEFLVIQKDTLRGDYTVSALHFNGKVWGCFSPAFRFTSLAAATEFIPQGTHEIVMIEYKHAGVIGICPLTSANFETRFR